MPMYTGNSVSAGDLALVLEDLGVRAGDGLMVHSSLSAFGHLEGGARAALDALMAAVGPEGTLVLPSFNHGAPFRPARPATITRARRPTNAPSPMPSGGCKVCGITPPRVRRLGLYAEAYTALHHRTLTMEPIRRSGFWLATGACLLMGVGYRVNSSHHVAETLAAAPYQGGVPKPTVRLPTAAGDRPR